MPTRFRRLAPIALVTLIASLAAGPASAAPGDEVWSTDIMGTKPGRSQAFDVAIAPDGSSVASAGWIFSPSTDDDSYLVVHDSDTGAVKWAKRSDRSKGDLDQAVAVTYDPAGAAIYVTGTTGGGRNADAVFVTAYDTTGRRLWDVKRDGPTDDYASAIVTSGKAVVVTGSQGTKAITVAYKKKTGDVLWTAKSNNRSALDVVSKGPNVYVGGWVKPGGTGDVDAWMASYTTSTGASRWSESFAGPEDGNDDNDTVLELVAGPDGSHVFGVADSGDVTRTMSFQTVDGTIDWNVTTEAQLGGFDSGGAIAIAPDGGMVFVANESYDTFTDASYMTTAYQTVDGQEAWASPAREQDPGDQGYALDVAVSPDGGSVYVTGDGRTAAQPGFIGLLTVAYQTATGTPSVWEHVTPGLDSFGWGANAIVVAPDGGAVFVAGQAGKAFRTESYET